MGGTQKSMKRATLKFNKKQLPAVLAARKRNVYMKAKAKQAEHTTSNMRAKGAFTLRQRVALAARHRRRQAGRLAACTGCSRRVVRSRIVCVPRTPPRAHATIAVVV